MDLERCLGEPGDESHSSNLIHLILTLGWRKRVNLAVL